MQDRKVRIRPLLAATLIAVIVPVFAEPAGIRLSPSRAMFLVLVPLLTVRLLMGRYGRVRLVDGLVFLHVVWLAMAIAANNPDAFVTFVGSNAIILLGGYLVGRATIRDAADMRGLAWMLGLLVLASLPFAFYETRSARMVIPPLIDRIPGFFSNHNIGYDRRLGFDRVQFVFAHPIHYGLWCSLAFGLVLAGLRDVIGRTRRLLWAGAIGFATFLSLSSGPFLAMIVQVFLAGYGFATRRVAHSWRMFMIGFAAFYAIAEVLSDRPAYLAIVSRLTFSTHTTYLRQTLLEFGIRQIERTPLLGIGYNTWELPHYMTGSLDNYWLMTAIVYGLPAFLALFGAYLLILIRAGRRDFAVGTPLWGLRFGYLITMIGLGLSLATVAIWSEMATMVFLMLGAGVWFAEAKEAAPEAGPPAAEPPTRARRYSRFGPAPAQAPRRGAEGIRYARSGPSAPLPPEPAE